jgi:hypothetical protein
MFRPEGAELSAATSEQMFLIEFDSVFDRKIPQLVFERNFVCDVTAIP